MPRHLRASARLFAALSVAFLAPQAHAYVPGWVDTPYAQQGVDPSRAAMVFTAQEQIDLFSGQLSLDYSDMCIDGAYGLDMCIRRTYSSKIVDEQLSPVHDDGWAGVGWLVNPGGRLLFDSALTTAIGGEYYVWIQLTRARSPARPMPTGTRPRSAMTASVDSPRSRPPPTTPRASPTR